MPERLSACWPLSLLLDGLLFFFLKRTCLTRLTEFLCFDSADANGFNFICILFEDNWPDMQARITSNPFSGLRLRPVFTVLGLQLGQWSKPLLLVHADMSLCTLTCASAQPGLILLRRLINNKYYIITHVTKLVCFLTTRKKTSVFDTK